jgi:class 3 adenylate cyclase
VVSVADAQVVRLGVRMHPVEDLRRIGVVGGMLYAVAGAGGVIFNRALIEHISRPGPNLAVNVILAVFGVAVVAGSLLLADATLIRLFPPAVLLSVLAAPPAAVLGLGTLGFGSFQATGLLFVLVLIYGFYLLVRPLALVLLAETAASVAILFGWSDGVIGRGVQTPVWVVAFGAVGYLLGRLVDQAHAGELERMGEMRRFLPTQVADAIMGSGGEAVLAPHRREIAILFADLRGFTRFAGDVEPEEVLHVLAGYHSAFGDQVAAFGATVGTFSGDGVMAYLNDPHPCDRPATRIVEMGLAFRSALEPLRAEWARAGYELSCGIGIAMGHATLGVIGVEGRHDYTALGTAVNLAARLCDAAQGGQILIDRRVHFLIDGEFTTRQLDDRPLKGFATPVPNYEVVAAV